MDTNEAVSTREWNIDQSGIDALVTRFELFCLSRSIGIVNSEMRCGFFTGIRRLTGEFAACAFNLEPRSALEFSHCIRLAPVHVYIVCVYPVHKSLAKSGFSRWIPLLECYRLNTQSHRVNWPKRSQLHRFQKVGCLN